MESRTEMGVRLEKSRIINRKKISMKFTENNTMNENSVLEVSQCYFYVVSRLLTAGAYLAAEDRLRGAQASAAVAHELSSFGPWSLEHRLSSCSAQVELLCGMWDFSSPGIRPMFLALEGRFFSFNH